MTDLLLYRRQYEFRTLNTIIYLNNNHSASLIINIDIHIIYENLWKLVIFKKIYLNDYELIASEQFYGIIKLYEKFMKKFMDIIL